MSILIFTEAFFCSLCAGVLIVSAVLAIRKELGL
jgi:hypothetical protein